MTLDELIADARARCDDNALPYLTSDEQFMAFANQAQVEASIRASLLPDDTSPFTSFALVAAQRDYRLDSRIWRIDDSVEWQPPGQTCWHRLRPRHLGRNDHDHAGVGNPCEWMHLGRSLRIFPEPTAAQAGSIVRFRCYRTPLDTMDVGADEPEISIEHHDGLPLWMVWRALNRPDSDTYDPQRAAQALAEFTTRFGDRPDADVIRRHNERRPVCAPYGGL